MTVRGAALVALLLALGLTVIGLPRQASEPAAAAPNRRPNIVVILTDDQTLADMAVMRRTRALLGGTGTTFRRAFATYPLCCPSRVTMLTGQFAHNHGVLGNELPWGGASLFRDQQALPVWLDRVGYRTAYLGKYLNGYPGEGRRRYIPPGWDRWYVPVDGIYDYQHYLINDDGELRQQSGYQTTHYAQKASRLITRYAAGRRPFFLMTSFLAPHIGTPVEPDDPIARFGAGALGTPAVERHYRNSLSGLDLPRKPSINERDISDKRFFRVDRPTLPRAQLREHFQQRRESLRSVDDAVATMLRRLDRSGERRNTLVVFTSDNGFQLGEHRWHQKIFGYEESIRVPLILSGPGFPVSATRHQLVSLADVTATLADAAGIVLDRPLDGTSLIPLAQEPARLADRTLLLEAGGWPMPSAKRLYTGVRTSDDFVLIRWQNGDEEVYDLSQDPFQLEGGVSAVEADRLPGLRRARKALVACAGSECVGG